MKQYEPDDYERRWLAYKNGNMTLDEAFEALSPEAREFVRSGATDDDWRRVVVEGVVQLCANLALPKHIDGRASVKGAHHV